MAKRTTNFSRGSHVPSATLNAMQDQQINLRPASTNPAGAPALTGADGRWWCTPDAGVADGQLAVVDATAGLNWRARRVWGVLRKLTAAAQRQQGASAWQANDPTQSIATRRFEGLSGTGGLGAAAATVANGTPPVVASGSFAIILDEGATTSDRVFLYARPSDGALCLYNDSGAPLHAELLVWGAAEIPAPGAGPPSEIPTLTEVQWLEPAAAADRPSDPGGPAIFRATDTGAVSLFDGGSWRTITTGGAGLTRAEIAVAGFTVIDGDGGAWHTIGSWRFDPAAWPSGVSLSLRAEGSVGPTAALEGDLRLVRATDGTVDLDGIHWSALDVTSETDSWTAPGAATVYLIQARHDPAADPSESLTIYGVRVVVEVA